MRRSFTAALLAAIATGTLAMSCNRAIDSSPVKTRPDDNSPVSKPQDSQNLSAWSEREVPLRMMEELMRFRRTSRLLIFHPQARQDFKEGCLSYNTLPIGSRYLRADHACAWFDRTTEQDDGWRWEMTGAEQFTRSRGLSSVARAALVVKVTRMGKIPKLALNVQYDRQVTVYRSALSESDSLIDPSPSDFDFEGSSGIGDGKDKKKISWKAKIEGSWRVVNQALQIAPQAAELTFTLQPPNDSAKPAKITSYTFFQNRKFRF